MRETACISTPLRVVWITWSLAWAAVWTIGTIHTVPHHACKLSSNLFIVNGQSCSEYGTVGQPGPDGRVRGPGRGFGSRGVHPTRSRQDSRITRSRLAHRTGNASSLLRVPTAAPNRGAAWQSFANRSHRGLVI